MASRSASRVIITRASTRAVRVLSRLAVSNSADVRAASCFRLGLFAERQNLTALFEKVEPRC